jgi:hypothetical protein
MVDFDDNPGNIADDERPIAVRRRRRTSTGLRSPSTCQTKTSVYRPHGISTPPATPKRSKKRVRFSDPGPAIETEYASSGLTPFIRRTTLSTPASNRRHSTPARLWNLAPSDTPISGTLQFEPLRQVLDGRVRRRLRRNRLSEEVNIIEWDKRHEAKGRKQEVERLRAELEAKDLEMQSMRDEQDIASQLEGETGITLTTNFSTSTKVQELEDEIRLLKTELQEREVNTTADPNWTMAAHDPYDFDDADDDMMITNYDQGFGESMINDELITTPTRLNTSFPSPPSTMPNTPSKPPSVTNAGIQTSFSQKDPEKEQLQTQLESLQAEISKLASAIAFNEDNHSRLAEKLSEFIPVDGSQDHSSVDVALDSVLTQLALAQSHVLEKDNAFSALSTEITSLGFTTRSGPEEILETIATQYRQARLDLEYLTPGEVVEGFENEKLLEMLVTRLRVLVEKVKKRDQTIDQYHEQEVSLRQQLSSRVDAMQTVQKELFLANSVVGDLRDEIEEKDVSNERLQKALEGYRVEVKGLENLIEQMEREGGAKEEVLRGEVEEVQNRLQDETLKHDTSRASEEGNQIMIMELERRLSASLQAASEVQDQIAVLVASNADALANKDATIEQLKRFGLQRERAHGDALALRDARVSELRGEIERVNDALKTAHSTILGLQRQNNDLEVQIEGEKTRGQFVVQAMREQLNRVLETGMGYINGDVSVQRSRREGSCPAAVGASVALHDMGRRSSLPNVSTEQPVVKRGRFLDGDLARKGGKKRRRYDSGLGFLEEEGDLDVEMGSDI